MGGRFWAGVITGGLVVAALDRMGVRVGPWLMAVTRWGRRALRPLMEQARRPQIQNLQRTTRRWLTRAGTR